MNADYSNASENDVFLSCEDFGTARGSNAQYLTPQVVRSADSIKSKRPSQPILSKSKEGTARAST